MTTIGLLHPGEMGAAVGAAARANGARVLWASEGRGADTRRAPPPPAWRTPARCAAWRRPATSSCPCARPTRRCDVARAVAGRGFRGALRGRQRGGAGDLARDRGHRGGGRRHLRGRRHHRPAARQARHHAALPLGRRRRAVRPLFSPGPLEAIVLPGELTAASAIKMAYAAWTKGSAGAAHGGARAGHGRGRGRGPAGRVAALAARPAQALGERRQGHRAQGVALGRRDGRDRRRRSTTPACPTASTGRPARCTGAWRSTRTRGAAVDGRRRQDAARRRPAHERDEARPIAGPRSGAARTSPRSTDWIRPDHRRPRSTSWTPRCAPCSGAASTGAKLTREDFPLPRFGRSLGRGEPASWRTAAAWCCCAGIPVERYSEDELRIIYWGLGLHLGTPRYQNAQRRADRRRPRREPALRRACARSIPAQADEPRTSRNKARSAGPLRFHTDRVDVVTLLCVRPAAKGGLSKVVSGPAVYNAILERRPDLHALLCAPYYHSREGEAGGARQLLRDADLRHARRPLHQPVLAHVRRERPAHPRACRR